MIRRILITAGPTRERIDPIRFISNYSTGVFGYKIADEARRRGLSVTLISGPTELRAPGGVKLIRVESALDMDRAVSKAFPKADCVIMAAAVSDWRVKAIASHKIKRHGGKTLQLVENPDIISRLGRRKGKKVLACFALETDDLVKNARGKLKKKNVDFIIANRHNPRSLSFGDNKTDILILDKFGGKEYIYGKSKGELAKIILDKALKFKI